MSDDEKAETIIDALNEIAREYDSYEYGLPMASTEQTAKMVAAVVGVLQSSPPNGDSPAAWGSEPPTAPGYYWMRRFQLVAIAKFVDGFVTIGGSTCALEDVAPGAEWCGPIEPPR